MWDQQAWYRSLDHELPPLWKYVHHGGSADDCSCWIAESQDGIAGIYVPERQDLRHIDSPKPCPVHPYEDEPGARGSWRNGKWYRPPELIHQQRQWFIWRWWNRDYITNAYCAQRFIRGASPGHAYAAILALPNANHPHLEEQIPPARMEHEFQNRLAFYRSGGIAPHAHTLKDGATFGDLFIPIGDDPHLEPAMPERIAAPDEYTVMVRQRHHRWNQLEAAVRSAAEHLARTHDQDYDPDDKDDKASIRMVGDGVGDRQLFVDYSGRFAGRAKEQVRAAVEIQFGGRVEVIG